MKPKALLIYGVVFAALAVFYFMYDVRVAEQKALEQEAETKVFNLTDELVQALRYRADGPECLIVAQSMDAWGIKTPIETPADRWTVEGLIRTALDGVRRRQFTADPDQLEGYGLVQPEIALTLLRADEAENSYRPLAPTLLIGRENPARDSRYARLGEDSAEIFIVAAEFYQALKKSLYDLRNKSLVLFPGEKIDRLRLSKADTVVLEKQSLRSWEITSPRPGPADDDVVQRLIYAGLKGRVVQFEPTGTVESAFGFDDPLVRIDVMSQGKNAAQLVVGRPFEPPQADPSVSPGRMAYIRSSERSEIMLAGPKLVDALDLMYDDLRDRHLLPFNRRMLTELIITGQGRKFMAVKEEGIWKVTDPPNPTSRDMDIESFLMAVEDLKYARLVDENDPEIDFSPDVVVEMIGLDEQARILDMDLTPIEERYIPVRIGTGPVALVLYDDLVLKLPAEVRPQAP